MHMFIVL